MAYGNKVQMWDE